MRVKVRQTMGTNSITWISVGMFGMMSARLARASWKYAACEHQLILSSRASSCSLDVYCDRNVRRVFFDMWYCAEW